MIIEACGNTEKEAGDNETPAESYRCASCGCQTVNQDTVMDGNMHRYVCGLKCMINFYKNLK